MKKLLVLVGFLAVIAASTASAAPKPQTSIRLEDGSAVNIYAKDLNIDVVRFTDGKNTCYIATSKITGIPGFSSISCVK